MDEEGWDRREALTGSILEFLEGWVVRELCLRFKSIEDSVYAETPERRLISVLLGASAPLTLSEIALNCHVSRDLVLKDGRIRRAIERMEKDEIVVNSGQEGRPRYSVNRRSLTAQLMGRVYSLPRDNGLASATFREMFGPG